MFSCFGGGKRDPDWAAHAQYGAHTTTARTRVLDVLAEELEERFAALSPAAAVAAGRHSTAHSQELLNRRLYGANLPSSELSQCRDLLRKLGAIDAARGAAESELQQLSAHFKAAETAHRQAEFARARAEAIATARGEALMHAQKATREMETQNVQLVEMLHQVLPLVGIEAEITPFKAAAPLPAPPAGGSSGEPLVRHSIYSRQQLAMVAASISQLPRQSIAALPTQRSQQQWQAEHAEPPPAARARERQLQRMAQQGEEEALRYRISQQEQACLLEEERQLVQEQEAAERRRRQRRQSSSRPASRQSSRERGSGRGSQEALAEQAVRASLDGDQLSGFTVYTNELEAAQQEGMDEGEVSRPQPMVLPPVRRASNGPERDSQGSGVQWRSISSAALSSRSAASEPGQQEADEVHAQRDQWLEQQVAAHQTQNGLRGSRQGSQEQAVPADEGQQPNKLYRHARHLSKLVLPGLDASQLDSLVRIGASMQSPDPHARAGNGGRQQSPVEVVQQLLPAGLEEAVSQLDSSINPLQSNENARAFLSELHAEMQRQGGSGGDDGIDHGHDAAGYDFYMGAKFPGAGTWVSPSMAAMLAHKKGYNPLLEGGAPSPLSHIKAVFGTNADKEFYGPMAAHLNRQEQPAAVRAPPTARHAPPRQPAAASAESIQGPQRQPPSNRSSFESLAAPAPLALPAPAPMQGGLHRVFVEQAPAQQAPQRRQAALRSGFQPMGMHAQASMGVSQQAQQAPPQPRRSSVAVSQLGGGASHRSSASSLADENHQGGAGLAPGQGGAGAGMPPRRSQHQQEQLPPTKRSLDSMRASVSGSGPGAQTIQASLHAVDAAMAALRNANPHLSREQQQVQQQRVAPSQPAQQVQQQQQYGPSGGAAAAAAGAGIPSNRGGVPRPAHHTRTRSLPDVPALDLPLAAQGEEQRRQQQQQHKAGPTGAGGTGRRQHPQH